MNDYSQGVIEMKRLVDALWKALIEQRFTDARELCNELVVAARLTKAQIGAQTRDEQ